MSSTNRFKCELFVYGMSLIYFKKSSGERQDPCETFADMVLKEEYESSTWTEYFLFVRNNLTIIIKFGGMLS